MKELILGDKNQRGRPPPKRQGTEFKWREEKQKPKLTIRNPFQEWKREKNLRHQDNLDKFTGFWHGQYWHHGVAQKK